MAKYTDSKCKLCRREGDKLFLKGDRCNTAKCAMVRRNYPPGQHGQTARKNMSDYNTHLREKQKAKRIYGLLEKQFENYFIKANKAEAVTGDTLMQLLERRLDNTIFRLGFAKSRSLARQIVCHGHIQVNGRLVDVPSFQVKEGDTITIKESAAKKNYFTALAKVRVTEAVPGWLKTDAKSLSGEVVALPKMHDIDNRINTQLIVEYYSK